MYELENDDEIEIDLRELFLALKKKIVWILLTAIVFAGASGLITKFAMTPIYSSTAQLYVVSKGGLSQLTDLTMGSQLTQDYMVIVKTRPVLEQVIADLKLDMDYKELEKKITVENPSDTRIMQITSIDHWIAFVLLGLIGINMVKEALSNDEEQADDSIAVKEMFMLAVATSIDALAVGITFAFLNVHIVSAASMIGVCTFLISFAGVKIGNIFGTKYKSKAELAGGIILILLGFKILFEHLHIL